MKGDDNVQVYLWQTLDGEIVKEEFYFLDYVVSWDREADTLTTARLKGYPRGGPPRNPGRFSGSPLAEPISRRTGSPPGGIAPGPGWLKVLSFYRGS